LSFKPSWANVTIKRASAEPTQAMKTVLLFLSIIFLVLVVRLAFFYSHKPILSDGKQVTFSTILLSDPKISGTQQEISANYGDFWYFTPVKIITPQFPSYKYGEILDVNGKIKIKHPSQQNTSGTIAGNATLQVPTNAQPTITVSFPKIEARYSKNISITVASVVRSRIATFYDLVIPKTSASLLFGIVFGVRNNFPKDFLKQLQVTGVVHVTAAEGLNVILLSGFLLGIFSRILTRKVALALTIVGLLFYCVVCGLQPSIIRSTVMISLALLAQVWGRQYAGVYGLLFAGMAMLFYDPLWLFDVGFQLSFAATMGILFLKPLFPDWAILTDAVGTTLAAQIATLPILLGTFGSYGFISVLANALTLWTIPPLMILGGIGGLTGIVIAPLGKVLLYVSLPFLLFFEWIIGVFAQIPLLISVSSLPLSLTVGYYLLLIGIILFMRQRKQMRQEETKGIL